MGDLDLDAIEAVCWDHTTLALVAEVRDLRAENERLQAQNTRLAALAADMPDGRTIAQWLDALAALEAACREAPWIWSRHAEAAAHPGECRLCGHSWPCPSERIRHLLPEARP